MLRTLWTRLAKLLDTRTEQERVLLLAAGIALPVYLWWIVALSAMENKLDNLDAGITIANSQNIAETNKQAEIKATFTKDPNAFGRSREMELRAANNEADQKLNDLYGQLIDAKEMSSVLTRILQNETMLKLVSLENLQPQLLLTTDVNGAAPDGQSGTQVNVYKHGLKMTFEGGFLDTVHFLRSLEQLDTSFFWDSMDYKVQSYPNASITLEIYTLSTQQGWLGV